MPTTCIQGNCDEILIAPPAVLEFWYAMANSKPQKLCKLGSSEKWICLHATAVHVTSVRSILRP